MGQAFIIWFNFEIARCLITVILKIRVKHLLFHMVSSLSILPTAFGLFISGIVLISVTKKEKSVAPHFNL